jgi:DNA-binding NtrC family response regulator
MATTQQQNRILIIEDDASIRGLMARHFSRRGFEVEQAEAAEEVIERFGGTVPRFDVVLTDVHLPGQSGVDFARRIKEEKPDQAIVFMTGDADNGIAREALRSGAAGFLMKPFQFSEVDTTVRNVLQRKRAHVTVAAKVVLGPLRTRRTSVMPRIRVGATIAAVLMLGWLAGAGLGSAPSPAPIAAAPAAGAAAGNNTTVVPVVIERSVYLR